MGIKTIFAMTTLMFAALQANASVSDSLNPDQLNPDQFNAENLDSDDPFVIHVGGGFDIVWDTHRALQEKADFKCAKKGYSGATLLHWQCTDPTSGSGKAVVKCF